jgi:hypothetical protein
MRQHSERFAEFHWPSVELLINLVYTADIIQTQLARKLDAHKLLTTLRHNVRHVLAQQAD